MCVFWSLSSPDKSCGVFCQFCKSCNQESALLIKIKVGVIIYLLTGCGHWRALRQTQAQGQHTDS